MRSPVGYRQAFLAQYHPNHTAYLPAGLREQLHALGRSPADQTPAGTFAKDILNRLLIDLSWAIEYLVLTPENAQVQTDTVIALHAFLSDGLMAAEITDPFEQAFFLMVHLPYLQPFEDVNKHVSRLAANIPFIRHNLCPLSFIDVPQPAYVDAMLGVYELNRVELLRDVFVWAYERSCQQYVAMKQNLVPPDMFRLRHRQALAEVIAAIARQGETATAQSVRSKIPPAVPLAEHHHFVQLVLAEFAGLHVGNAVRFGIRPLEFFAWLNNCQG